MLRVESQTNFTEYEEDILFDADDPDFHHSSSGEHLPSILFRSNRGILFRETTILSNPSMPSTMSLASVHPAEVHSSHSSLTTLSHSLEDISTTNSWSTQSLHDHVMTIEELRLQMTSCFTCGVSWNDSHISLDCKECGGYALERPCPICDGNCGAIWKRDLSLSHSSSKARWQGECHLNNQKSITNELNSKDLSSKLEKLSANS